jgi:nucleoside phosphorylase
MPEKGNSRAAIVANQLLNDFPSIRFVLLVGIGGGVRGEEEDHNDIRLGDFVVSKPTATFGGVVQYDLGKVLPAASSGRDYCASLLQFYLQMLKN